MAEYIDRETILNDLDIDIQVTNKKRRLAQERNCVEDRMRYHKKLDYLRGFYQYIKSLSTANVIPLDKVKKAREEIQKLRGCSCSCTDGIIDDVEDILDKLIESEEE